MRSFTYSRGWPPPCTTRPSIVAGVVSAAVRTSANNCSRDKGSGGFGDVPLIVPKLRGGHLLVVVGGGGSGGSLRRIDRRSSERREGEMDGAKRSGGGRSRGAAAASSSLSPPPTPPSSVYPSLSPYTARRRAEQRRASVAFLGKPQLCRRRRGGRPLQRHRHDGHGLPVSLRLLPTADLARLLCRSPRRLAARPSPALPVRGNPGWRPLRCRPSSRCSPPAPPTSATHLAKLKEDHAAHLFVHTGDALEAKAAETVQRVAE